MFVAVSVLYISMSVNIAERPTFEKKKLCVCKRNLSSSYILFEGRIMKLIVSVKDHCISVR